MEFLIAGKLILSDYDDQLAIFNGIHIADALRDAGVDRKYVRIFYEVIEDAIDGKEEDDMEC